MEAKVVVRSPPRCRKGKHQAKAARAQKTDRSVLGRLRRPFVEHVFFVFKLKNELRVQGKEKDNWIVG